MRKHLKYAAVILGIATVILTIGARTTPATASNVITTPALDSVVKTYYGIHDLDIAPQVLSDLGKDPSKWWICRAINRTPELGDAEIVSESYPGEWRADRLLFTAWMYYPYTGQGDQDQAQLEVTLCGYPSDPTPQRPVYHVGIKLQQPVDPTVGVHRDEHGFCHVTMTNQDPVLGSSMRLWRNNGTEFGYFDPGYPGTPTYVLGPQTPRKLQFSIEYYDRSWEKSYATIYGSLGGEINRVRCTMKITQSYK